MTPIRTYKCVLKPDGRPLRVAEPSASSADQAARIAHAYLKDFPHEELIAILLDGANNVIGVAKVSQGGLHGCSVLPCDVLRPVIVGGARAFVLAHNHPSGDPTPSGDDIAMTRGIREASDVLGVTFLDHVIVTRTSKYCSMLEARAMS